MSGCLECDLSVTASSVLGGGGQLSTILPNCQQSQEPHVAIQTLETMACNLRHSPPITGSNRSRSASLGLRNMLVGKRWLHHEGCT